MAQISSVITTTHPEFRSRITKLLRTSGLPVSIVDEKHQGNGTTVAPHLAVIDIRSGTTGSFASVEQARGMWPAAAVFAVAASTGQDQILEAMRAGANEFLVWGSDPHALDEAFRAALQRTAEKTRTARDGARAAVTFSFFGA